MDVLIITRKKGDRDSSQKIKNCKRSPMTTPSKMFLKLGAAACCLLRSKSMVFFNNTALVHVEKNDFDEFTVI